MGWERIGRKPRSHIKPDEVVIKIVGKGKKNLTVMVGLDVAEQAGFRENETVDLVIGTDENTGLYKLGRTDRGTRLCWKSNRVDYKTSRVPTHMSDMKMRATEIVSCENGEIVFKVSSK